MTDPTPRQLEALRARCELGNAKEAAHRLGIRPGTVDFHLRRLLERCGCTDIAQACYRHFGPGTHDLSQSVQYRTSRARATMPAMDTAAPQPRA